MLTITIYKYDNNAVHYINNIVTNCHQFSFVIILGQSIVYPNFLYIINSSELSPYFTAKSKRFKN